MRRLLPLLLLSLLLTACQKTDETLAIQSHDVIYHVFVPSFYDSNGDGVGDLNGITKKLDYIRDDLGAHAIYLSPIHPSDTYHKYDVKDYYGIDESFGDMGDFETLIEEAHKKDMKVILDLVLNHSSSQHPWFLEAKDAVENGNCDVNKYCDYYNFTDEALANHTYLANNIWYESVFWSEMPDLNLDNESLYDELMDISKFWIDKGVDGFRLDAVSHFYENKISESTEFLKKYNQDIKAYKDDFYIVAEAWEPIDTRLEVYKSGIDSVFNFDLSQQSSWIVKAVQKNNAYTLANQLNLYYEKLLNNNPNGQDAVFLSNHDQGRSASYFMNEEDRKMTASIYLLMPGKSYVYYGEEIGLLGSGVDENKRLPMQWGSKEAEHIPNRFANADYKEFEISNVDEQMKDSDSLWNHYKKIIRLRTKYPELSSMDVKVSTDDEASLLIFDYKDIKVMHNLSREEKTISFDGEILDSVHGNYKYKNNQLDISAFETIIYKTGG